METLRKDGLAYLDSFVGLIPCKVLSVYLDQSGATIARVKITAGRAVYTRGEVVERGAGFVIPRKSLRTRGGQVLVVHYDVEVDSGRP